MAQSFDFTQKDSEASIMREESAEMANDRLGRG